jgi:uncharacterized protein (DUF3820 family)
MFRHGRATMPWGKHRGARIKLLPDAYLSFLTTTAILKDPKWWWLRESLIAELKHRGLSTEHLLIPCGTCGGSGEVLSGMKDLLSSGLEYLEPCSVCNGTGEVPRVDEVVIEPIESAVKSKPKRAYRFEE